MIGLFDSYFCLFYITKYQLYKKRSKSTRDQNPPCQIREPHTDRG